MEKFNVNDRVTINHTQGTDETTVPLRNLSRFEGVVGTVIEVLGDDHPKRVLANAMTLGLVPEEGLPRYRVKYDAPVFSETIQKTMETGLFGEVELLPETV